MLDASVDGIKALGREHDARGAIISRTVGICRPVPSQESLFALGLDPQASYHYAIRPEAIDIRRFGTILNYVLPIHLKEEGTLVNLIAKFKSMPSETLEGKMSGAGLMGGGLKFPPLWNGTGYGEKTSLMKAKGHEVRVVCSDEFRRGEPGFYIVPEINFGPFNHYVHKNGVGPAKADDSVVREALKGADICHFNFCGSLSAHSVDIAHEMGIPCTASLHTQAENFTNHVGLMDADWANNFMFTLSDPCAPRKFRLKKTTMLYCFFKAPNGLVSARPKTIDIWPIVSTGDWQSPIDGMVPSKLFTLNEAALPWR